MPDGTNMAGDEAFYTEMSTTLLSKTPATAPMQMAAPERFWPQTYNHLQNRMNSLRVWRYSFWAYAGKLAEFFSPRRWIYLPIANKTWRMSPINDQVIDSTGLQALNTCAGGMWSGLTNPNTPWFKLGAALLGTTALDAPAKAWLESTETKIYTVLSQSNFYSIMHQAFSDVVLFGTSPILVYEDVEDVARFYLPCAGEYFLGMGARLSHDTFAREFTLTTLQIVEMFGLDNCPTDVQKAWEEEGGSVDREFVIHHLIEPNYPVSDRGKNKGPAGSMVSPEFPYREFYWIKGNKGDRPLSVRGFRSFPVGVLMWNQVSNDVYGRSPCMDCLGDNKQIQLETRRKAEFIEKGVRPPMGANPELKNEPASIMPAHITYMSTANNQKGFWPLFEPNPNWLPAITDDIKMVAARLEKALFVDVFMAITQMEGVQPRNELELTQRNLERLQSLGPIITGVENTLAQMLQRVLDIMVRRRLLDPLPPSLQQTPLKVSFVSIMRMAQRASEAVALKDLLQTAGVAQSAAQAAGLPSPLRLINLDAFIREYGDITNTPATVIFTPDQVEANDKAHAAAQQQAQAPASIMAAVQAAHTLAATPTGPGTALSAVAPAVGAAL
jgi:hypothetical protein